MPSAGSLDYLIAATVSAISDQPHRGRPVPEYVNTEVREVREGDYRIIYRLHTGRV